MFTGIITAVGRIAEVRDLGASSAHGKQLVIEAPAGYLQDVGLGDSIALNGACMTATQIDAEAGRFAIDISAESLARTAGLDRVGPDRDLVPVPHRKGHGAHERRQADHPLSRWRGFPLKGTAPVAGPSRYTAPPRSLLRGRLCVTEINHGKER